jgi:hypothetical protein
VTALGQLALIKALSGRLKAHGKLRRLHIRPRQLRVAILDIARAFALAVAALLTVHTAAIRGRVAHRGKAADLASFQRNRLGQDRADALHGEPLLVRGRVVQTLMDGLFQHFDLWLQTVQHPEAPGDRQHLGLLGQQAREWLLRPLLNPFDAAACTSMTRHDVVHPEDIGGMLTDHMRAFA